MEEIFKGLDVVSVLKVGLPGLVFLLSLFSYRLLASEQQNAAPRKVILDSIRKYTYINLTFAVLTLLAPLAELSYGTDTKNKPLQKRAAKGMPPYAAEKPMPANTC